MTRVYRVFEYNKNYSTDDSDFGSSISGLFKGIFHSIGNKISFKKAHKELGLLIDEAENILKASSYRWHYMCMIETINFVEKNKEDESKLRIILNGLNKAEGILKSLGSPSKIGKESKMKSSAISNLEEGFRIWKELKSELEDFINDKSDEISTKSVNINLFQSVVEKGSLSILKTQAEGIFSDLEDKEEGRKKTSKLKTIFSKSIQIAFEELKHYYDISCYPYAKIIKKTSPVDEYKRFLGNIEISDRDSYSSSDYRDDDDDRSGYRKRPDSTTTTLLNDMPMLNGGSKKIKNKTYRYFIFDLDNIEHTNPDIEELIDSGHRDCRVGILLVETKPSKKLHGCIITPDNKILFRTKDKNNTYKWDSTELKSRELEKSLDMYFDIKLESGDFGSKKISEQDEIKILRDEYKKIEKLIKPLIEKINEDITQDIEEAILLIEADLQEYSINPTSADKIRKEINQSDLELLIKELEQKQSELSKQKPNPVLLDKQTKLKDKLDRAKTELSKIINPIV